MLIKQDHVTLLFIMRRDLYMNDGRIGYRGWILRPRPNPDRPIRPRSPLIPDPPQACLPSAQKMLWQLCHLSSAPRKARMPLSGSPASPLPGEHLSPVPPPPLHPENAASAFPCSLPNAIPSPWHCPPALNFPAASPVPSHPPASAGSGSQLLNADTSPRHRRNRLVEEDEERW